jgi:hypothetical protein
MRMFKIIGALALVLAFSAIGVATASAEEFLWKLLPGSVGETFTTSSGKATLEGLNKTNITCAKSKGTGELLKEGATSEKDATLALATITFESCKAAGLFPVNSLGDAKEVILSHLEIHNCLIKPGDYGLLIKPLPVHLEVPSVGLLITVEGDFVGLLEATANKKVFNLNAKQISPGDQEITKCEGGTAETLTSKDDAEPVEDAAEEVKEGKLTFDGKKDVNGEELMEK